MPTQTLVSLAFPHPEALARWFAAYLADGRVSLEVPEGGTGPGGELSVSARVEGQGETTSEAITVHATARVLEWEAAARRAHCTLTPRADLMELLARHALSRRAGRQSPAGGRRQQDRYDTFLKARFRSLQAVTAEYVTNISRGGLFVRTLAPPPLGTKVEVALALPDGSTHEVTGSVVRVVSQEEALARGGTPGVGLQLEQSELLAPVVEWLVQQNVSRPRRVLVVDDDVFFLKVIGDSLMNRGVEVALAHGGPRASRSLVDLLYDLDAVVLDLYMPGIDGHALIERIRRFGREMDLRIVVVSGAEPLVLQQLVGPGLADAALSKRTPLQQLCADVYARLH